MQHYRTFERWCCIFLCCAFREDEAKDAGYRPKMPTGKSSRSKVAKDPKGFLEEYQERKKKSGSISRVL